MAYKILEIVRDVGKYVTYGTCAVSILRGVIYWKLFATPVWVAYLCILGVFMWVVGGVGVWLIKYRRTRASRKTSKSHKPAAGRTK